MTNPFNIFLVKPAIAQTTSWSSTCVSNTDVATIRGIQCLLQNVLQIIVGAAGLVFFAMLIIGGFKYLTSGGDPKKTASASSTLGLSFMGLLGVLVSWLILLFIQYFTGVNVTNFNIN